MKYEAGDKVKVIKADPVGSGGTYREGDIFTVESVENDVITSTAPATKANYEGNIQLYFNEVEPYKEDEDEVYNGIVSGLSQAIENAFHRMSSEDKEWEAMEPVGKEIIYDDYNPDSVEHPPHYTQGKLETIEIIAQTVGGYDDGFTAHCVGTATKYLNRAPFKHETPLEDLKKAAKYLEFAIEHEEKKQR